MPQLIYGRDSATVGRPAVPVAVQQDGAVHTIDAVDISGRAQVSVAISGTATQSAALSAGIYDLWATVDCYVKVAADANGVTTATGYLLRAGNTVPFVVPEQQKIGAITSGAAGSIAFHRVR